MSSSVWEKRRRVWNWLSVFDCVGLALLQRARPAHLCWSLCFLRRLANLICCHAKARKLPTFVNGNFPAAAHLLTVGAETANLRAASSVPIMAVVLSGAFSCALNKNGFGRGVILAGQTKSFPGFFARFRTLPSHREEGQESGGFGTWGKIFLRGSGQSAQVIGGACSSVCG